MSTLRAPKNVGWLRTMLASPWRVMCLVSAVFFLSEVQKFYDPTTGFSSLISIGERVGGNKVTQLKRVQHYVYEDSSGYDGAYYVQLALNPTLDNPELKTSIDNLPYRAKRILFCWSTVCFCFCLRIGFICLMADACDFANFLLAKQISNICVTIMLASRIEHRLYPSVQDFQPAGKYIGHPS